MSESQDTSLARFDYEEQDALLSQMQAQALRDFHSAATIAERSCAVVAFSEAARGRHVLAGPIAEMRHDAYRESVRRKAFPEVYESLDRSRRARGDDPAPG